MFLDKYFVMHDWSDVSIENYGKPTENTLPKIGIYDKWHPTNGNWMPPPSKEPGYDPSRSGGGNDPLPADDEEGSGTFWTIFLILFFIAVGGILFKLYGKSCIDKFRGGTGTFQSGDYVIKDDSAIYSSDTVSGIITGKV